MQMLVDNMERMHGLGRVDLRMQGSNRNLFNCFCCRVSHFGSNMYIFMCHEKQHEMKIYSQGHTYKQVFAYCYCE